MLVVAGHLLVAEEERDAYVADCVPVVEAARAAAGCLDFAVTADSVDPRRVVVHERWTDEAALLAFRGSGPSDDQQVAILDADVRRFEVAAEAPA